MWPPEVLQLFKDAASEVIVLCFVAWMGYRVVSKWFAVGAAAGAVAAVAAK